MSLMLNSIAVINPSKFEGWSSSVEQAKSFGKKVILSNISVHREQNPKRSIFFNTDDHKSLSKILIKCLKTYDEKKEIKITVNNFKFLENRMKKYGEDYLNKINKIIN